MATRSIHVAWPQSSLIQFPPSPEPATLSPPTSDFTLARPFNISDQWYNYLLKPEFPITIALVFAVAVTVGSRTNQQRGWKPWAFSRSSFFLSFVVAHNVFLAAYSTWTFVGMANAFKNSWPGWENENGLVGMVDSMCKINGPRGLGSAATYNVDTQSWAIADPAMKLLNGLPDSTDVGRIWNEGLAFYGWLFYISKFYEVVDTLILFIKGKKSSMLQTFHHAGAMVCVWAGIRYMSPPIWMFVFINSGIHGLMYTYYALSALSIRVPPTIKQTITTLQIAQFIFGASYAAAHLFLSYDAPINVPYLFTHNLSTALSSIPTSVSSVAASATASAGLGNLLKKVALRAAGEEGLAENVRNKFGEPFGVDAVKAVEVEKAQQEIRYRMGSVRVNCIDTSGEAFAIWLNVLYLAPLTLLFFRFFARSYRNHSSQQSASKKIQQSGRDASHDVKEELKDSTALGNSNEDMDPPTDVKAKLAAAKARVKSAEATLGDKASTISNKAGELYEQGKDRLQKATNGGIDGNAISNKAEELYEQGKNRLQKATGGGDVNGSVEGNANGSIESNDDHANGSADHVNRSSDHVNESADAQPVNSSLEQSEDVLKEESSEESKEEESDGESETRANTVETKEESPEEFDDGITDALKEAIGDAQAYEASIDEVKNEVEDQAEKEMQREGL